jgi:O-antigen chain-terminating methyltransferase
MSSTQLSLDELVQRIRAKAAWDTPAMQVATETKTQDSLAPLPSSEQVEFKIREKSSTLHVRDFFSPKNMEEFIQNAYRKILLRPADAAGQSAACDRMKQGRSRSGVLVNLANSSEGRAAAVEVRGLGFIQAVCFIERVLWALGLKKQATAIGATVDKWFGSAAEDFRRHEASDLALLRLIESWRKPLESQVGRTSILERELAALRETLAEQSQYLDLMRSQVNVLLQKNSVDETDLGMRNNTSTVQAENTDDPAINDYYLVFEDANRGTHEEFIAKLQVYSTLFEKLRKPDGLPVLDIGCGRGELLDYLAGLGVRVQGIDLNSTMIRLCRTRGHNVLHIDALTYLRSLPSNSLACVTGFHIIEHLPFSELFYVMQECMRVLAPSGFILFETPNPENMLVASHTFYHDFSHRNPITPTAIQFLARYHGFHATEIIRCNPYPDSARVPGDDPLTQRINGHFCGPQDFALIAHKSESLGHGELSH